MLIVLLVFVRRGLQVCGACAPSLAAGTLIINGRVHSVMP